MSALIFPRRDLTVIQNKELPCKLFLHEYLYCFKLRDSKPASRQHCLILHSNFPWPKHLYRFLTTSCVVTAAWTNNPPTSPPPDVYILHYQVRATLEEILEKLPEEFNMVELLGKAEQRTPYQVVVLQECERMNILTQEIRRSLQELSLGLKVNIDFTNQLIHLGHHLSFISRCVYLCMPIRICSIRTTHFR